MSKKKRLVKKIWAYTLSLVLLAGILLQYVEPFKVEAAATAKIKNINLNVEGQIAGISDPDSAATISGSWSNGKGSYVYFGNYYQSDVSSKEPVKWRVLDTHNDSNGGSIGDSLLLLSDKVLDGLKFNESSNNDNVWIDSNIRKWLNSDTYIDDGYTAGGFLDTAFNSNEQTAIGETTKSAGTSVNYLDAPALTGEKIFLLSAEEADKSGYGFWSVGTTGQSNSTTTLEPTTYAETQGFFKDSYSGGTAFWWLRSAKTDSSNNAGVISSGGALNCRHVIASHLGVSPAFNLKLSSVFFTSASGASKSSFTEVEDDKVEANTWKLTISDGNENFTASCSENNLIAGEENKIDITNISNATVDSNQITAALINKDGEVLYYGKIAEADAESATVIIPEEANLTTGDEYTLQVFSEQVNGDKETDYASNVVPFTFTVLEQVTSVTADSQSSAYTEALQVTLASETDGARIYYTTNGDDPEAKGIPYNGSIKVEYTQTIKSIAVKDGMADSNISTFDYIIKQTPTVENLEYDLSPVTYNKTAREITATAKGEKDLGTITVKYNGKTDAPVNAGTYEITVDISGSDLWNSATDIELGIFTINPKTLTNVSAVIPDVKQDSPLTLENQLLPLNSEVIEEGDSVSGMCKVTLGNTIATGDFQNATVDVDKVNNTNYTFTGTLEEQNYTVIEKTLTYIKITNPPNKMDYFVGEIFDKTGMEVTAYYDSGDLVILGNNEYSVSPSAGLTNSDNMITVSYGDMTDTTSITGKAVELTNIIITKAPDKTECVVGQSFSDAGMVVKAQYNNGVEHEISGYSYSPKDALTTVGTHDIIISYTEGEITKEAIQQVNVIAKVVRSIEVTRQPNQRSYIEGQKLSLSELVVSLTFNDKTSQDVAFDDFKDFSITTSIADGTVLLVEEHNGKAITVTCEGVTAKTENLIVEARAKQSEKETNTPNGKASDKIGTTTKTGTSAKTGDTAGVIFWAILVLISGMVISGSVWYQRKRI